jgi:hypothetical protein
VSTETEGPIVVLSTKKPSLVARFKTFWSGHSLASYATRIVALILMVITMVNGGGMLLNARSTLAIIFVFVWWAFWVVMIIGTVKSLTKSVSTQF